MAGWHKFNFAACSAAGSVQRTWLGSVATALGLSVPLPPWLLPGVPSGVQVIQPVNGDPFIGMLETPVTSSPLVAAYLSNLPAYRCAASRPPLAAAAGTGAALVWRTPSA